MRTAVDTNVLLDVFLPDPVHGKKSSEQLRKAYDEGSLIICDVVYAELAPQFEQRQRLDKVLAGLGIQYLAIDAETAFLAGQRWKKYRREGGKRTRIISDFLIGAHAESCAERLLTRDREFYQKNFRGLRLL